MALFAAAMVWLVCARAVATSAANGLALRFGLNDTEPLLQAMLLLFLAVIGVAMLRSIDGRGGRLREALGLPARATSREEWRMGAAIGWGLAVASILPMALGRSLNAQIWNAPRAYSLLALSLLTLAALTLAHAIVIFGYALPRLIEATGPARATLVLVAVAAVHAAMIPVPYSTPQGTRLLVEILATVLLCLCWTRTHAVWLAWGLHFAWAASTAALFGLPLAGDSSFGSVLDTRAVGPVWLTGGAYGPEAAALSIVVLIVAIPVLVRVTDDYAWEYTRAPIVSGGYDVTIAPPAAHVAMEEAAQT
ncbi:MAG TPA: CPBP family intramembrane glutamate endopeptidase, partial [Acidobacteriaceae bacterium]